MNSKKKTKERKNAASVKLPAGLPSSNWVKMQAKIAIKEKKPEPIEKPTKTNATAAMVAAFVKQKNDKANGKTIKIEHKSTETTVTHRKRKATTSTIDDRPDKKLTIETSQSSTLSLVDQAVLATETKRTQKDTLDASKLWFAEEVSVSDLKSVYGHDKVHSGTVSDEKRQRRRAERATALETATDTTKIGKYLAIDCEMVGVGPNGSESALARVSIVNFFGHPIMDKFVKTKERVTDYRTFVSGITPTLMKKAESFESVQTAVSELLDGRIIVGHAIHHDLKALMLSHPRHLIRDTQLYKPFRKLTGGRTPSLKRLVELVLKKKIQDGAHSSVEDAAATMMLYRSCKDAWDREMGARVRLAERRKEEKRQQQQRRQRQLNAQVNATLSTPSQANEGNNNNNGYDDDDDEMNMSEDSE